MLGAEDAGGCVGTGANEGMEASVQLQSKANTQMAQQHKHPAAARTKAHEQCANTNTKRQLSLKIRFRFY